MNYHESSRNQKLAKIEASVAKSNQKLLSCFTGQYKTAHVKSGPSMSEVSSSEKGYSTHSKSVSPSNEFSSAKLITNSSYGGNIQNSIAPR